MVVFRKDASFDGTSIPYGYIDVAYPPADEWDLTAFEELKKTELAKVDAMREGYDRHALFDDNPFYRYFKKFKKSYPVMMQLESYLLKGRPFPTGNPINEVCFLTELRTQALMGTHDVDQIHGDVVLFRSEEKIPYSGMGGRDVHIYPGDISAKDDDAIILSMIAGADDRTCIHEDTTHIVYLFFATDGMDPDFIRANQDLMISYLKVLAPTAVIERNILL